MKSLKNIIRCISILLIGVSNLNAQTPDSIYLDNIKTVRLYPTGNQLAMPVINLNSSQQVELHFDDLDGDTKYYYYTLQLCNSDWQVEDLSAFDYLKGFTQIRINTSRYSSVALTRYTHYQATIPDNNMFPTKSGNYLLKVFLNGDASKVAFTKRLMVVDNKASILAKVTQPFAPEFFRTHQKVQFTVDLKALNDLNASQQLKVVVLQNYRWDIAAKNMKPAFVRGSNLEYNSENSGIFPGGKEWRWLDLRDFHLQSDRVATADYNKNSTDIFLRPDGPLDKIRYVYYADLDGLSMIEAIRGVNPYWEADYASVYFSFVPPNGNAYPNKDIYLYGQLSNYGFTDSIRMNFNSQKQAYETRILMKQGYYDYTYIAVDKNNPAVKNEMDGNNYETENNYTILIYYRPFAGRSDQLIGFSTFNSRTDRPGIGY
ncbi:MAG: DUF5103 domain-containing protein [Ginsengibacter sp.]